MTFFIGRAHSAIHGLFLYNKKEILTNSYGFAKKRSQEIFPTSVATPSEKWYHFLTLLKIRIFERLFLVFPHLTASDKYLTSAG